MDLMSVAEEEDGEGEAGLEVDDRPSMLPEHWLPVERCWWHVWKLWGNGPVRAGEMVWECGSGREGVCSDWANQSRSWGDWIEQSQIARHGLGVEGEGREQQRRAWNGPTQVLLKELVVGGTGALGHWATDTVLPSRVVQETNPSRNPKPKRVSSSSAAGKDAKIDRENVP